MKHIGAALAAVTLLASPAFAADAPAGREAVSLNVSSAGINLATTEGVAQLQSRINRAIAEACKPATDEVGNDTMPDFQCRREMAANVQPQMQQIAARATATRFGSNTGL